MIFAGYSGGYGNTIMIDHGNGDREPVRAPGSGGLKWAIGCKGLEGRAHRTVGSTGNSTGPHLHFEVRINGAPKNPMTWM